jgi:hypothetical protein
VGKHLVADVVTPMSLPVPWWALLYELPWRELRKFAHDAYGGSAFGEGRYVRSGLLAPPLAVLTTVNPADSRLRACSYAVRQCEIGSFAGGVAH